MLLSQLNPRPLQEPSLVTFFKVWSPRCLSSGILFVSFMAVSTFSHYPYVYLLAYCPALSQGFRFHEDLDNDRFPSILSARHNVGTEGTTVLPSVEEHFPLPYARELRHLEESPSS